MLSCAWRQRWIVIPSTFFLYCLIEHIWTWNCGWLRANLLANSNIYQKNKERKGWKFYIITYMHGYLRNSGVDLYLSRTWSLTDINISAGCVCVCACAFSHVQLFATPWTVTCQASLSMGFPRQEYWNGLLFPTPGNLSNPGIKPVSLCLLHWQVVLYHQGQLIVIALMLSSSVYWYTCRKWFNSAKKGSES